VLALALAAACPEARLVRLELAGTHLLDALERRHLALDAPGKVVLLQRAVLLVGLRHALVKGKVLLRTVARNVLDEDLVEETALTRHAEVLTVLRWPESVAGHVKR
jgi:hypothetical protein